MSYDPVEHPQHYTKFKVECIDIMEMIFGIKTVMSFCLCNAFKYLFRCFHKKNTLEDIKKARWYLDKYIQLHEKETNNVQTQNLMGE